VADDNVGSDPRDVNINKNPRDVNVNKNPKEDQDKDGIHPDGEAADDDVGSNPGDVNVDKNPINDKLEWDINDDRWCLLGSHSYPTLPQEASTSLAAPCTSNTNIAALDSHLDNQTNDD